MESLVYVPTYEVFVILEAFRERFHEHLEAIHPLLLAADEGPLLIGADCYYRAHTDVALLAIRLDERTLTRSKLSAVAALAREAERPLLDPRRLSDDDRRSFYRDYLPLYDERADDCDNLIDAIERVASALGVPTPETDQRPTPWAVGTATEPMSETSSTTRPYASPGRAEKMAVGSATTSTVEDLLPPGGRSRASRARPPSLVGETPEPPGRARGKGRHQERAGTVPGSLKARDRAPSSPDGSEVTPANDVAPPGQVGPGLRGAHVNVRFLRGDKWMPGRLRGLNMKSARIATGAPPRSGDLVQVAVGLEHHGVVLRGRVTESQTGSAALESGFTGFEMEFPELTEDARDQLRTLLLRARERGLSLRPPPPRSAIRFPLNWPVRVLSGGSPLSLSVLDISERGLFVAAHLAILDEDVLFELPDDVGGPPITGRARVVREVTDVMARERGLEPGYGLHISKLSDEERFEQFVSRVARRCVTRILVGASRARANALTWDLAALGYTVSTTTSPAEAARAASGEELPPDLAILDDSLTSDEMQAQLIRRVYAGNKVPCIAVHGARPSKTRATVDELLRVSR